MLADLFHSDGDVEGLDGYQDTFVQALPLFDETLQHPAHFLK